MHARSLFSLADVLDAWFNLRVARNVICLHLLWAGATYSQRTSSSFGPMSDLALGYPPLGLAWLPSTEQIAVLGQEKPAVYLYSLNPSAAIIQMEVLPLSESATEIASGPGGPGAPDQLALLAADEIRVLLMQKAGETYEETVVDLPGRSQRIAYGDINSDRRVDLLLFGKRRAGITTLLRQKDGKYLRGPLLFPDLSLSSLQCLDLNGDGITDVFAVDWLSGKLDLFFGIGKGAFSEQVGVALPGEPENIAVSSVTEERTAKIAVTIPDQNLVTILRCNSTGEIEPTGSVTLPFPPLQVRFVDANDDRNPDLVVTTSRAVFVFPAAGGTQFGSPASFGSGTDIRESEEVDLDDDRKCDLVFVDQAAKHLVAFGNSHWSGRITWPSTYATGISPHGVVVTDLNDDGLPDIAVTNSGSSSLSVLLNRGNGLFEGQAAFAISEKPVAVAAVSPAAGRHTLLTSHTAVDRINIVHFTDGGRQAEVSAIPTGPGPSIVFAKQDTVSGQLEMLVRNRNPGDGSQSLALFQQITGGSFVERSIRARLPGRITAMTVGDFSGSGEYELVFATYDRMARQSALSIAFPDGGFDFRTVRPLFSFSDSTGTVSSIISGYVDGDRFEDLVLVMGQPRNTLGIVYGRGGGAFTDSIETIHDAHPLSRDEVLLKDVNGDGRSDLTWIDTERKAVVTAFARGDRTFGPAITICPANHITAIQISSLKAPPVQDLILVDGLRGCASIVFDPFRR